jgi:5'-methylthioadenosine phosphorylase
VAKPRAELGVIGGSGFYALLDDAELVEVDTPYGPPSDPLAVGEVGGLRIAFLARHGRNHRYPPHRIPYRANLWALRSLGVRQVLGPCAVGGLRPELGPGTFVVPDQLVDRTNGRVQTFHDDGAVHVNFADPYCPNGRAAVLEQATHMATAVQDGGTLVVVEGPRFSTRAESRWFASQGWSLVGMTGYPEAALARELALCYTCIALVTDLDAGIDIGEGVTQAEVFAIFEANIGRMRELVLGALTRLPIERTCLCAEALDGISVRLQLP